MWLFYSKTFSSTKLTLKWKMFRVNGVQNRPFAKITIEKFHIYKESKQDLQLNSVQTHYINPA